MAAVCWARLSGLDTNRQGPDYAVVKLLSHGHSLPLAQGVELGFHAALDAAFLIEHGLTVPQQVDQARIS